jgi:hypothetical protein
MGIPLSQEVTLRERNNSVHGTSSTLQFLNQRCPVVGNPVEKLINFSSISNCISPTLALHPLKVMENYHATHRLKPSNRFTKVSYLFSSKSLRALSNINRAFPIWLDPHDWCHGAEHMVNQGFGSQYTHRSKDAHC